MVVPAAKMVHALVAASDYLPQVLFGFGGAVAAAAFYGAAIYGEFFHLCKFDFGDLAGDAQFAEKMHNALFQHI